MRYKKILLPIILIISPLLLLVLTSGGIVSPAIRTTKDRGAFVAEKEYPLVDESQEMGDRRLNEEVGNKCESSVGSSSQNSKEGSGVIQGAHSEVEGSGTSNDGLNTLGKDAYSLEGEYPMNNKGSGNRGVTRAQVIDSPVYAKITHDTTLYNTVNGGVLGNIEEGQEVEIIQDRTCAWYEISFDDTVAWVKSDALKIPPDPPTDTTRLTNWELEQFLSNKGFDSDTPHFLWVDIHRQLVYAFERADDQWELIRTMVCSTGVNESPTTRGLFSISDRDTWMYSKRLGSGAKYWVRFNNTYLFHSVAFAEDGQTIIDDTLGERSSAGCVRLSLEDSKWIYDNMKEGTGVWVN